MGFISIDDKPVYRYELFADFPEIQAFTGSRAFQEERESDGDSVDAHDIPASFLAAAGIDSGSIARMRQVHGSSVAHVSGPGVYPDTDAMVTDTAGVTLCVVTADCLPVFLYDRFNRTVGAVHAGWRGLQASIIGKTVARMTSLFNTDPRDVYCEAGPFIQARNYEVGPEVSVKFPESAVSSPGGNRCLLDLGAAAKLQMTEAGIPENQCRLSSECTFENETLLHSYRRDGEQAGRNFNIVTLTG